MLWKIPTEKYAKVRIGTQRGTFRPNRPGPRIPDPRRTDCQGMRPGKKCTRGMGAHGRRRAGLGPRKGRGFAAGSHPLKRDSLRTHIHHVKEHCSLNLKRTYKEHMLSDDGSQGARTGPRGAGFPRPPKSQGGPDRNKNKEAANLAIDTIF